MLQALIISRAQKFGGISKDCENSDIQSVERAPSGSQRHTSMEGGFNKVSLLTNYVTDKRPKWLLAPVVCRGGPRQMPR